ncbi:MAG: class I SAM-dependent methyltransferase [Microthrixaceae bacterium]
MDVSKVEAFLGQLVVDLGATASTLLTYVGDQLGLYGAMAGITGVTPEELAASTGTDERMIREWLSAQAAAGYVDYDPDAGTFTLPAAHAAALAFDNSPASVAGFVQTLVAGFRSADRVVEAVRTGKGLGWADHHHELFDGIARVTQPSIAAHLTDTWLSSLDGVADRLHAGAAVADVGCGYGAAVLLMADAFPASTFVGFDAHAHSIERARSALANRCDDRVRFEVSSSVDYPTDGFDLICFFDSLHDMGDPLGAARHARESLAPDGSVFVIEPIAGDRLEHNLNPVGRLMYAASTFICTPCSLDQDGPALGSQAGPARIRALLEQAGFTRVEQTTVTPFNYVLQARP